MPISGLGSFVDTFIFQQSCHYPTGYSSIHSFVKRLVVAVVYCFHNLRKRLSSYTLVLSSYPLIDQLHLSPFPKTFLAQPGLLARAQMIFAASLSFHYHRFFERMALSIIASSAFRHSTCFLNDFLDSSFYHLMVGAATVHRSFTMRSGSSSEVISCNGDPLGF